MRIHQPKSPTVAALVAVLVAVPVAVPVAVAGSALFATLTPAALRREVVMTTDAPSFKTPGWQKSGELLLRAGSGGLLLKHRPQGAVYRYAPRRKSFDLVAEHEWQAATGAVAECGRQLPPPPDVAQIAAPSNKLRVRGGQELQTAGSAVLLLRASPDGRQVAVLSADGRRPPPLFPALGGGVPRGRHFHQLLSLPAAVITGPPVRLPRQRPDDVLTPCWSPDQKYVVYTDQLFFTAVIIEIKPPGSSR